MIFKKRAVFPENHHNRSSHLPDSHAVSMRTIKADGNTAANISDLEKNRMDVAASQAFVAEAVNIGEGISSADMYIEHYQKGKLVETVGPVSADYSEEKE